MTETSDQAAGYREALLSDTREELERADGKASILLAASGIALSALLTLGRDSKWYPDNLDNEAVRALAWAAMALTLAGIILVGIAVKPRLRAKHRDHGKPHYFGDVQAYRPMWWKLRGRTKAIEASRQRFVGDLERVSSSPSGYKDRLDDQIWQLSHIAYRKYRFVSRGMWFYLFAVISALVALVIEKWL